MSKEWVEQIKATQQAINDASIAFAEIRDAVVDWGFTRKQADRWCMMYFKAALERDLEVENMDSK